MLIIGESHYGDKDPVESIDFFNKVTKTRELHSEIAIEGDKHGTKIFPNLYNTLFPGVIMDEKNCDKFWQLASY